MIDPTIDDSIYPQTIFMVGSTRLFNRMHGGVEYVRKDVHDHNCLGAAEAAETLAHRSNPPKLTVRLPFIAAIRGNTYFATAENGRTVQFKRYEVRRAVAIYEDGLLTAVEEDDDWEVL